MNEDKKAETDRAWNTFRPGMETLAARATAFYAALGSTRTCRHINELWHPENAAVGIGFVPPEAKDRMEALIMRSGIRLHKGNGPLGKGVYFSLLHDGQLTPERLQRLGELLEEEVHVLPRNAASPKPALAPAPEAEPFVERVEGFGTMRGDKLRTRPAEVAGVVDAFNGATMGMNTAQTLAFLASAVPFFNLPDISRHKLLHTVEMMNDAESKG